MSTAVFSIFYRIMSGRGEDKNPSKNPEPAQVLYSTADNQATDANGDTNTADDMATRIETSASGSDSVAAITVEDVEKFNYDNAFDWLEENDVDPGNLQSLPELIKLIKSHITKAKSQEDLSKVGKDVAVIPPKVTSEVSVI